MMNIIEDLTMMTIIEVTMAINTTQPTTELICTNINSMTSQDTIETNIMTNGPSKSTNITMINTSQKIVG